MGDPYQVEVSHELLNKLDVAIGSAEGKIYTLEERIRSLYDEVGGELAGGHAMLDRFDVPVRRNSCGEVDMPERWTIEERIEWLCITAGRKRNDR